MTPTHTPACVCEPPRLEEVAARAVAYLRTLGPGAELATAALAAAIDVSRATLVASLMPVHGRDVKSNGGADGVTWRVVRQS